MPAPQHAAFLRGVNLGSRRRAGRAELRAAFEGLGLSAVETFRASGNVVFAGGGRPSARLAGRIEEALQAALGFPVSVFLRSGPEMRAIAAHEPFERELVDATEGRLQVILLGRRPAASTVREVLSLATDDDRLAFGPRELYWLPRGGTRAAALGLGALERLLGPTTMRTRGTMEELARKWFAA